MQKYPLWRQCLPLLRQLRVSEEAVQDEVRLRPPVAALPYFSFSASTTVNSDKGEVLKHFLMRIGTPSNT